MDVRQKGKLMDNNINADTILAVVRKLIGNTEPYGDSAIDCNRTENLDNLIHVIDGLLRDVEEVAVYKERNEFSMQTMGKKADEALTDWHAYIEEYFTIWEQRRTE